MRIKTFFLYCKAGCKGPHLYESNIIDFFEPTCTHRFKLAWTHLHSVFRIRDSLVTGSDDLYLWLTDLAPPPDPALFISDFNKKYFFVF